MKGTPSAARKGGEGGPPTLKSTTEGTILRSKRCRVPSEGWWSRQESNLRPSHCERDALPTELRPHSTNVFFDGAAPRISKLLPKMKTKKKNPTNHTKPKPPNRWGSVHPTLRGRVAFGRGGGKGRGRGRPRPPAVTTRGINHIPPPRGGGGGGVRCRNPWPTRSVVTKATSPAF